MLQQYETCIWIEGPFSLVVKTLESWEYDFPPKISWTPDAKTIDDMAGQVDEALNSLYEGNRELDRRGGGNPRLVIFADEAQFYAEKGSGLESLMLLGPKLQFQVVVISQFPERLQNKRILGACVAGVVVFFLDVVQRSAIEDNYGVKFPDWIGEWCAKLSYRAAFYDQAEWHKVPTGEGDEGEEDGTTAEDEGAKADTTDRPGAREPDAPGGREREGSPSPGPDRRGDGGGARGAPRDGGEA